MPRHGAGRQEGSGERVWSGKVVSEDRSELEAEACFVSGEKDVFKSLVPSTLVIKGPVHIDAVEDFLISQLSTSRSRAYAVAELRARGGAAHVVRLAKLSGRYNAIEKTGRAEPKPGLEVYFIPPGPLAETLVEACLGCKPKAAGLTMVVVHKKKWRVSEVPPPAAKRPRQESEASTSEADGGTSPTT